MRALIRSALLTALWAALPLAASAQATPPAAEPPIVLLHGRIVRVSAPVIPDGVVVIEDGKIAAVGASARLPKGARVIDVKGLSVYPGFFDADTTLGITFIGGGAPGTMDNRELGQFNPAEAAGVAVDPTNLIIPTVRTNGITTALTAMRAGLIAGQASVINLAGWTTDQMNVRREAALWVNFPQQQPGGRGAPSGPPPSRADRERAYQHQLASLRDYFDAARRYATASDHAADPDVELAAMAPYLAGKLPVILVVNRAADIRAAIHFGEAEHLRYALAGAKDAWQALDLIKQYRVPVIYGPLTALPNSENDPYDAVYLTPAQLLQAGVPLAITTGSAADVRNLAYNAALAEAYGLPAEAALKAITLVPAQILGLDSELGSIDPGKRANLFVANGDPLDVRTTVKYLFIDGHEVPLTDHGTDLYHIYMARH